MLKLALDSLRRTRIMAARAALLSLCAAAALAHGGGGADASVGVAQLDAAGLAALVETAARSRTAAVVRFYMNS